MSPSNFLVINDRFMLGDNIIWYLVFDDKIRAISLPSIGCLWRKFVATLLLEECEDDALLSPLLDPLEGLSMLNCGKLGLEGRSRFPALKGGIGAC
jgi:hypothetical protein